MGLKWNGELKRLAAAFCAVFAAVLLAGNLCAVLYGSAVRKEYNRFLAVVTGNVKACYPQVEEEQLLRTLTDQDNREEGEAFLRRYGVFEDGKGGTLSRMEEGLKLLQAGVNLFGVLLLGCAGGMLLVYFRRRQEKIQNLTSYLGELNRGRYTLEIEDNNDDELSGLRNELYRITVFLREQAQLVAGQKEALADSVADISHQLKTPLTSIMVLADNLAENDDMDRATRKKFTGEIIRQLSGMSWLVATMLKLSRLEAGVVELERGRISMRMLLDRALEKLEMEAEWRGISFSVSYQSPGEKLFLYVDEKWTAEAFVNILKNALEHSPRGGSVELFCSENEVYTELKIKDHGEGISEEERKKLFRRFYRGKSAGEDSAGIGLALAREIVERQGGMISVDSEEGKGTVFCIKFLNEI